MLFLLFLQFTKKQRNEETPARCASLILKHGYGHGFKYPRRRQCFSSSQFFCRAEQQQARRPLCDLCTSLLRVARCCYTRVTLHEHFFSMFSLIFPLFQIFSSRLEATRDARLARTQSAPRPGRPEPVAEGPASLVPPPFTL